ncbi:MAG: hypothetical protein WBA13_22310 [Microcoleaceae cyanobacterium]
MTKLNLQLHSPRTTSPHYSVIPGLRCCIAPEPRSWVHLWERPNPYSDDEALLLCPLSEEEWVAWVAGHGEIILRREQFFSISE